MLPPMPEDDSALALFEQIDAEQRRLRDLLSGKNPAALAEARPTASGR